MSVAYTGRMARIGKRRGKRFSALTRFIPTRTGHRIVLITPGIKRARRHRR